MKPVEWVRLLLDRHGLLKADGRPLYQYRVTDDEFDQLSKLLKLSSMFGVQNTTSMLSWDAVFVMYGAEWWRRYYNSNWGWDGIFDSIGIDFNELPNGKRNDLVESGLHRWGREVRAFEGNRKFLGTIATECGLPLCQLADSSSWLKIILQIVVRKNISSAISISVLINNYQDYIPKSFRTSATNQILADFAELVVSLPKQYPEMDKDSTLEWLDENQPNWRGLFPLPINDESGRSLLSDLVNTASKTKKNDSEKNDFIVERFLIRPESDNPDVVALLDMPIFVSINSLGILDYEEQIPASLEIEVFEPNGSVWPWCKALRTTYRGYASLKLSGRTLKLTGLDATKELRLRFKSMGVEVHECALANGFALDESLPWLFKKVDEKWALHGTASQSIKDECAMAFIPKSFVCHHQDEIIKYGELLSGSVFKISGAMGCEFEDVKYMLSAGIEESIIDYQLSGKRFEYSSSPSEVFIGIPDLVKTNLTTGTHSSITHNRLIAKPVGIDTYWTSLANVKTGYYEVRLIDEEGNIQLRKRIGILDEYFSSKIIPDSQKAGLGSIQLVSMLNCDVSVIAERVKTKIIKHEYNVDLYLESDESPPSSICVSLLPKGHNREISLTFPYPSKGAVLFDPRGKVIQSGQQLFLSNLNGYRLKIYVEQFFRCQKITLRFQLVDSRMRYEDVKDIFIEQEVSLKSELTEFSIGDWVPQIESVLSIGTSLDSTVQFSVLYEGADIFSSKFSRFEHEIIPNWNDGAIGLDDKTMSALSFDDIDGIQLSALFLHRPEQIIDNLDRKTSGGAFTGTWAFNPEKRECGPWLIYPLESSEIKFRTLLWNVGETIDLDIDHIDSLPKAISIDDNDERRTAIRYVLRMMASDLEHKSWGYLHCLWGKTSHLPMITFDLWKYTVSEPGFLACLLIKGHDAIVEKLEAELPLIWELVRLIDWQNSLNLHYSKLARNLGDVGDEELINGILKNKIEKIESLSASMISIGKILRKIYLKEECQDLLAMKLPVPLVLQPRLNDEIKYLMRRQANNQWPDILSGAIYNQSYALPDRFFSLLSTHHIHQRSVIFLPLLLAWRAMSSDTLDWPDSEADLFSIKQLKGFDEDWFNAVFSILSGWLSQQAKLESLEYAVE